MERKGATEALVVIKYFIPTYESCTGKKLSAVAREANETPYERRERRRLAKKQAELDDKLKNSGILGADIPVQGGQTL
jgi:hypothetical protein